MKLLMWRCKKDSYLKIKHTALHQLVGDRGFGERKKNATELKIEPASRDYQADRLTTQPRRLFGTVHKPTQ